MVLDALRCVAPELWDRVDFKVLLNAAEEVFSFLSLPVFSSRSPPFPKPTARHPQTPSRRLRASPLRPLRDTLDARSQLLRPLPLCLLPTADDGLSLHVLTVLVCR